MGWATDVPAEGFFSWVSAAVLAEGVSAEMAVRHTSNSSRFLRRHVEMRLLPQILQEVVTAIEGSLANGVHLVDLSALLRSSPLMVFWYGSAFMNGRFANAEY